MLNITDEFALWCTPFDAVLSDDKMRLDSSMAEVAIDYGHASVPFLRDEDQLNDERLAIDASACDDVLWSHDIIASNGAGIGLNDLRGVNKKRCVRRKHRRSWRGC